MNTARVIIDGYVWKSQQNGALYNPNGVAPTLVCGNHAGVEPKIMEIEYEDNNSE